MESEKDTRMWIFVVIIAAAVLAVGALLVAVIFDGKGSGKYDFNDDNNPSMGPEDAKVTVRIYSDFQCPACKYAHTELNAVLNDYKNVVKFIWNDFPLVNIHPNALNAATAARCAQKQNGFWDFADDLFTGQEYWANSSSTMDIFGMYFTSLRLSANALPECYQDKDIRQSIIEDMKEAQALKLQGTPAIFINDELIPQAMGREEWKEKLDAAIAAVK